MNNFEPADLEVIKMMNAADSEKILDGLGVGFAEVRDILAALSVRFIALLKIFFN